MGGVCSSPSAHQFGSVQYMRRSFASGWAEPSAFYGERLRDFVYYVVVEYRWGEYGLRNSVIRWLFDVGAGIRVENDGCDPHSTGSDCWI